MKAQCPQCKKVCFELTEHYDPDKRANGSMVRLMNPWRSWGWGSYGGPQYASVTDIECPLCTAPMAPSGRLRVVPDDHGEVKKETLEERNQKIIDDMFKDTVDYYHVTNPNWISSGTSNQSSVSLETMKKLSGIKETRDEKILRLRKEGLTFAKIGDRIGISGAMVGRIYKKLMEAK